MSLKKSVGTGNLNRNHLGATTVFDCADFLFRLDDRSFLRGHAQQLALVNFDDRGNGVILCSDQGQ